MIPLSLRLRNFMSYGLEGGELDLRPIHVACLSGGNGHGKSTLVDAITWVLWGKSRAAREDDLIRQGTTEMEVEFEFATHGTLYRVIRKRAVRKTTSTATLELHVRDGELWRAITGNHISDTERAISQLLRLSYETFINSSLLLQGKADIFTTKRPSDRKEILAEILNLGEYEKLAEAARLREREYKLIAERHMLRLEELDRLLSGMPALQDMLVTTEAALGATQTARHAAELAFAELDGRYRSLDALRDTLSRLDARHAEIEQEEAQLRSAQAIATGRKAQAEALLADEPRIREQLAALERARKEHDRLAATVSRVRELEMHVYTAQQTIAAERASLESDLRLAQKQLDDVLAADQRFHAIQVELVDLRSTLSSLPALQESRDDCAQRERAAAEQISALSATNQLLDKQRTILRKRIEALRVAGAQCPTCSSALSEARRQAALKEAMEEGLRCKDDMAKHEHTITLTQQEQQSLQKQLRMCDHDLDQMQIHRQREQYLVRELAALQERIETLPVCTAAVVRLKDLLAMDGYASAARSTLATVTMQLEELGYDAQEHHRLGEQIKLLLAAEQQRVALDEARASLVRMETELLANERLLLALREERLRLAADRQPLQQASAQLTTLYSEREKQRTELEALQRREGEIYTQLGRVRRQIEEGTLFMQERGETEIAQREAEHNVWVHKELGIIFGKRGIQAMLIENTLPELEQDTNELLARMTDNSTQVQFITQRQGSSGKAIETLDIVIADTMGTRTYEMFSGGEAFRINFAIRIALSKLLARRAGAELSFLLIDEGFGSQDVQGRDRLIEAISSISEDFEKILVVTHIEELKDAFEVRIDINKELSGSRIIVNSG